MDFLKVSIYCHWGHIIYLIVCTAGLQRDTFKTNNGWKSKWKNKHCIKGTVGILSLLRSIILFEWVVFLYLHISSLPLYIYIPPPPKKKKQFGYNYLLICLFTCSFIHSFPVAISVTYNQMFLCCYGYIAEKISCSKLADCVLWK